MPLGRVLVVDDEPEVGAVLRDALVDSGYIVKVSVSGREALGLVPVFQPDVVLLDVAMPGMSGVEVLDRVRREYPHVKVVMVTANQDEAVARQMLARGAFDYVPKPFDLGLLTRVVGAAVTSRQL
jgi:two-component system nitrogen regulation response regulator GlnG